MKFISDVNVKNASGAHFSYLRNVCLCEFVHSMFGALIVFLSKNAIAMKMIFTFRHILQVFQFIVSWISVFVIYFFKWMAWSNEGSHNESVELESFFTTAIPQPSLASFINDPRLDDKKKFFVCASPLDEATHLPHIANFVDAFVPRDRFPSCFHIIIIAQGASLV